MEEAYWERLHEIRVSVSSCRKTWKKAKTSRDKVYESLKSDTRIKSDIRIFLTKFGHVKFDLGKLSLLEELLEKNHNNKSYN